MRVYRARLNPQPPQPATSPNLNLVHPIHSRALEQLPSSGPPAASTPHPSPAKKTRSELRSPAVSRTPYSTSSPAAAATCPAGWPGRVALTPRALPALVGAPVGGLADASRAGGPGPQRPGAGCGEEAAGLLPLRRFRFQSKRDRPKSAPRSPHSSPAAGWLIAAATAGAATCQDSHVAPRGGSVGAGPQARGYSRKGPAARRGRGSQPPSPAC